MQATVPSACLSNMLAGTVKSGDTAEAKVEDEKLDEEVPDIDAVTSDDAIRKGLYPEPEEGQKKQEYSDGSDASLVQIWSKVYGILEGSRETCQDVVALVYLAHDAFEMGHEEADLGALASSSSSASVPESGFDPADSDPVSESVLESSLDTVLKLDGSECTDESSEGSLMSDSEVEDKEPVVGELKSELMNILVLEFKSEKDEPPSSRTPSELLNSCPILYLHLPLRSLWHLESLQPVQLQEWIFKETPAILLNASVVHC
ncbi:hypothetical protein BDR07DRAFT_1371854 [Suillus spraguei]|nr:hypothetical protein BDR07DRAFT_1371854 [Suillus spraguei]